MNKLRKILEQIIEEDDKGRDRINYDVGKTLEKAEKKKNKKFKNKGVIEMKEIKFKALYKGDLEKHKEYLPFVMKIKNDELMFVMEKDEMFRYSLSVVFQDNNWIKLQYTGLKDKNGKEIYEGDVLKCSMATFKEQDIILTVYWSVKDAGFNVKHDNNTTTSFLLSMNHLYEIIGNIYKNSELLTK